ncbi:MAG: TldD/PmbA family protein [Candidatus Thorarchaeota archaeon]|nr:MAG: TldD/PmbA family protein [Candidatus Thorarchaeota archaeon]
MNFDDLTNELLSVTDTGLKYAKSLDNSAEFEIYVYYNNKIVAEIAQGIVAAKSGAVAGTAVRASIGKQIGFAVASGVSPDRVKLATKEALSIIRSVKVEDDRFQGFADPMGSGKEGAYHDDILAIGTDDLIKNCELVIKEATEVDERVKVVSSKAVAQWGGYAVGNTRGILEATRGCGNSINCNVQAFENEERKGAYNFDLARNRVFNTEGLGKTTAENAVGMLGAKKLDLTAKMQTIWTPLPAGLYVMSSLAQSTVGRPVVDGVSPLCDRIGDTIASKDLTIVDDGQNPKAPGTQAVDAEGLPQKSNPIIENGVLKNYLFDSYFGRAFDLDSTGNCVRGGGVFGGEIPYENRPNAGTMWLEVEAGKKSLEDIISSIEGKAILVRDFPLGIFHSDVSTGEFSCVAGSAFLIENGEMKGSVEPVSIAGNYYEGFKNLLDIGSDKIAIPYGISVPTLVFDGFSVVG